MDESDEWQALSETKQSFSIFVIHSFEDMSLIHKIREYCRAFPSLRIRVAEWERRVGTVLTGKLAELIRSSHIIVVVWSHNLEESVLANQEIGYAVALGKRLFPFVAKGMAPKGFLEGTEYVEYDPFEAEKGIETLIADLRNFANGLGYSV